jgi:hypothetical protein
MMAHIRYRCLTIQDTMTTRPISAHCPQTLTWSSSRRLPPGYLAWLPTRL